jgi:hypothetical protein
MSTIDDLLTKYKAFKAECEAKEHTDTGEAWWYLEALAAAVEGFNDALKKGIEHDVDYRSAETGRYVTEGEALESPGTTIRENG